MTLYTIGHSNVTLEEFIGLLKAHAIQCLVDIRQYPGSRAFPYFSRESLSKALPKEGIEYHWLVALGGRLHRSLVEQSPNTGLKSPGFRNYADYMLTPPFEAATEPLLKLTAEKRTAIMCAERLYWRCHRMLVSDYLTAHGVEVLHILDEKPAGLHKLSKMAVVSDGHLTYPAKEEQGSLFDGLGME